MIKIKDPIVKQLLRAFLFLGLFFTWAIWDSNNDENKNPKLNKEYFSKLNEYFTGTITGITEDDGWHLNMIYLHIDSSTTKLYDIRYKSNYYYCVIKNDSAEVIEHVIWNDGIGIGDRFVFDGRCDSTYLQHKGIWKKWKPRIYLVESNMRKNHKLSRTKPSTNIFQVGNQTNKPN